MCGKFPTDGEINMQELYIDEVPIKSLNEITKVCCWYIINLNMITSILNITKVFF